MLGELYKQAGFLLQAKHFLETGEDLTRPRELLPRLGEEDRTVLEGRGGPSPEDGMTAAALRRAGARRKQNATFQ